MGLLVNILLYSINSLVLGIVFTVLGIVLMFIIIRLWWKCSFTLLSFVVGGILFFFLSYQAILLCGAVSIKSYSSDVYSIINDQVKNIPEDVSFSTDDSQEILDVVNEKIPLVGYYVNIADFEGHTPVTIADAMTKELNKCMNRFIMRRVAWSLSFILLGAFIVIKTISIDKAGNHYRLGKKVSISKNRKRISRSTRR